MNSLNNDDHCSCIIHGHCLNHVNHINYKYCPMKDVENYKEIAINKSQKILKEEKKTCERQIKYLKQLLSKETDKVYYDISKGNYTMLINKLEKLLDIYVKLL